ncbi:hypothetical protein DPEC_G00111000 [Dallia pectoralis]|uniref:Uncharacterized protein n=1 Tax=Dallia pectoralis TaxID=75939 RepID=A0ACC2GTC7_DALPE|nr:hypothetical protein DPEC_G00111000 [Dallia pectoralis]
MCGIFSQTRRGGILCVHTRAQQVVSSCQCRVSTAHLLQSHLRRHGPTSLLTSSVCLAARLIADVERNPMTAAVSNPCSLPGPIVRKPITSPRRHSDKLFVSACY